MCTLHSAGMSLARADSSRGSPLISARAGRNANHTCWGFRQSNRTFGLNRRGAAESRCSTKLVAQTKMPSNDSICVSSSFTGVISHERLACARACRTLRACLTPNARSDERVPGETPGASVLQCEARCCRLHVRFQAKFRTRSDRAAREDPTAPACSDDPLSVFFRENSADRYREA